MKNETETVVRISEGRKLIALFMGKVTYHPQNIDGWKEQILLDAPHDKKKIHYPFGMLPPFDTEWEWLMPVVEKIKQLYNEEQDLTKSIPMMEQTIFKCGIMSPIKVVYSSVVDFIKWYNETQARGANS